MVKVELINKGKQDLNISEICIPADGSKFVDIELAKRITQMYNRPTKDIYVVYKQNINNNDKIEVEAIEPKIEEAVALKAIEPEEEKQKKRGRKKGSKNKC